MAASERSADPLLDGGEEATHIRIRNARVGFSIDEAQLRQEPWRVLLMAAQLRQPVGVERLLRRQKGYRVRGQQTHNERLALMVRIRKLRIETAHQRQPVSDREER